MHSNVAACETPQRDASDHAHIARPLHIDRLHPVGSAVEIRLTSGDTFATKTKTAAFLWGGLALVEVEGRAGCYTLDALRPVESSQRLKGGR